MCWIWLTQNKMMLTPIEEKITVLHLEDDKRLSQILKVAFRSAEPGINVVQFAESNPLVDYFIENGRRIDMFILDIRIPGEYDGIDVVRFIRCYPNNVPHQTSESHMKPNRINLYLCPSNSDILILYISGYLWRRML